MRQPVHFRKVCPPGCGLLHDEQQTEEEEEDAATAVVVVHVVVVVDFPSFSPSILRLPIAISFPSFAALVHHLRVNSFDWATPWP